MMLAATEIKSIAFVGSGKVANGLASIFHKAKVDITGISSRNKETGKALAQIVDAPFFDSTSDLKADLILVAVADKSVIDVISNFSASQLVAFTAGSVSLNDLYETTNRAVFYPLQTFTESRALNVDQIPILLESTDFEVNEILISFCNKIGFKAHLCNSETRKRIHLSAVFVNNFVNHVVYLAQNEAKKNELDWSLFEPLMTETIEKLKSLSPYEAQTGPAKRNDEQIVQKHLALLSGRKKEIYELLSKSISETYLKK
jgi:predicted short-subunit dehydrogenase-like oxidoreductase (DUF2520 family)